MTDSDAYVRTVLREADDKVYLAVSYAGAPTAVVFEISLNSGNCTSVFQDARDYVDRWLDSVARGGCDDPPVGEQPK